MTNETMKREVRALVRGVYEVQKTRIQIGNRLVANFKSKLGQLPGLKEESLEKEARDLLKTVRKHVTRMADATTLITSPDHFRGDSLLTSYTEFVLARLYTTILDEEEKHFKLLEKVLQQFPVYTEWLAKQRGIGPALAGIIVSELDIMKARYPSSFHKYCGLDVAEDGKGRSKRREHLVEKEYVAKDGEVKTRMSITFNEFVKTKLVGVLGDVFIRCSSPYAMVYRNYKHRLEHHVKWKEATKKHRHRAAIRYMVKIFLIDLHVAWRKIEGLPVSLPYAEAKLGIVHHGKPASTVERIKGPTQEVVDQLEENMVNMLDSVDPIE